MTENKIKNLVIRFFETLECDITENKGVLKIKNIPQKFEKFYGKTGPYFFYFNESDKTKEGEYITKGSYILSCINKFLENRGETTLLKIKSDKKPIEIIKERFEIKNCSISEVYSKSEYKTLERFTFLTTFQYMNKKEEIVTRLFIQNGEKIDIDISKYNLEEGKKRDINMDSSTKFKQDYDIAKEKLKEKVQGKIDLLKEQLSRSLEEEKVRIQEHYEEQLKDDDKNIEDLKKQLDKAKSEKDTEKRDEKRIKRIEEQIKELKSENRRYELEKDKEASIDQEIYKHSLNIKNKLLNTTIIYYPVFRYEVYLKTTNNSKRLIFLDYDLFEDKISEAVCETCKKKTKEIILCSSGHLTCRECGDRCEGCGDIVCKKCVMYKCSECGKKMCKKCSLRCPVCGKLKCASHFTTESFGAKKICRNCSKRCMNCGKTYSIKNIKKTKTGKEICDKCFQEEVRKNIMKKINI